MLHVPPEQVSEPLQNVPSSHGAELFVWMHVPEPSHRSSVQTLESLEHGVVLLARASAGHVADPPVQTSAASHSAAASRQTTVVEANPSAGHEADVPLQVSPTSQMPEALRQLLPVEKPSAGQLSELPVQFSATSHTPFAERHTVAALAKQSSVDSLQVLPQMPPPVHGSPVCAPQVPPLQVSSPLQNSPSSHGALLAVCAHVPLPSQKSSVQTSESLVHGVEPLANESAGHVAEPLQTSATSHSPLEPRQVTDVGANALVGHEADVPLQVSATSQIPDAARQVLPDENEFAGHDVEVPVQVSAESQTPEALRQTVEALAKQSSVASLQVLPQMPPPEHGLPECTEQLPPEHVSTPLQ
jgi:hypothetical protein